MSGMEGTISERGRAIAQTSLKARLQPLLSDLYDAKDNPGGIVDMGTAENVSQHRTTPPPQPLTHYSSTS